MKRALEDITSRRSTKKDLMKMGNDYEGLKPFFAELKYFMLYPGNLHEIFICNELEAA